MTLDEISNIRIISQKIAKTEFKTANDIVAWMGALQAQDFSMAKLALGVRTFDSTERSIEASFNKGEIIRTHLMRPTWHFVSAQDIYWMLELTSPQIKSSLKSRHKELGLTESIFTKSNFIIEKSLSEGHSLSREQIANEFNKAKIQTDANRLSHLLLRAELDGILCSGSLKANKQTFSLLHERVPNKKMLTRDESLVELAKRYFRSHCPATLQDFAWWSGLSRKDALHGMESVKHGFVTETIESGTYLFPISSPIVSFDKTSVHLLPAYDEFLIGYRDRSASLSVDAGKKSVSVNGIFYPLIVVNGQVTGLWKRSFKSDKAVIEPILFKDHDLSTMELIEKKVSMIGQFLDKEIEVRY
jgi:hypothetical protein